MGRVCSKDSGRLSHACTKLLLLSKSWLDSRESQEKTHPDPWAVGVHTTSCAMPESEALETLEVTLSIDLIFLTAKSQLDISTNTQSLEGP